MCSITSDANCGVRRLRCRRSCWAQGSRTVWGADGILLWGDCISGCECNTASLRKRFHGAMGIPVNSEDVLHIENLLQNALKMVSLRSVQGRRSAIVYRMNFHFASGKRTLGYLRLPLQTAALHKKSLHLCTPKASLQRSLNTTRRQDKAHCDGHTHNIPTDRGALIHLYRNPILPYQKVNHRVSQRV